MNYSMAACIYLCFIHCMYRYSYVSCLPDACVCVWTAFNLRKELHCFSLFLLFTGHSPLMAVMENETWPHPSYVPDYLLRGDPFASRLSREADIVAAFYICIIGQSLIAKNCLCLFISCFNFIPLLKVTSSVTTIRLNTSVLKHIVFSITSPCEACKTMPIEQC